MSSPAPNPSLTVIDVGHGSAALLCDEGGTVLFDAGVGARVNKYLEGRGISQIHAILLSHADNDHIGGAVTILLNKNINIDSVHLNPDATKNSEVFLQLRIALCDAAIRSGTNIHPSLTTSTSFNMRQGSLIEVLYPSAVSALAGVGGKAHDSKRTHTSNSLSAAIRISRGCGISILLGGDIEFDSVDHFKNSGISPQAKILLFPHHGGQPGTSDSAETTLFAYEIASMVAPELVVFSIHRTQHDNPRNEIIEAVSRAVNGVRFACTQLPEKLKTNVSSAGAWALHLGDDGQTLLDGSIEFVFVADGVKARFVDFP